MCQLRQRRAALLARNHTRLARSSVRVAGINEDVPRTNRLVVALSYQYRRGSKRILGKNCSSSAALTNLDKRKIVSIRVLDTRLRNPKPNTGDR